MCSFLACMKAVNGFLVFLLLFSFLASDFWLFALFHATLQEDKRRQAVSLSLFSFFLSFRRLLLNSLYAFPSPANVSMTLNYVTISFLRCIYFSWCFFSISCSYSPVNKNNHARLVFLSSSFSFFFSSHNVRDFKTVSAFSSGCRNLSTFRCFTFSFLFSSYFLVFDFCFLCAYYFFPLLEKSESQFCFFFSFSFLLHIRVYFILFPSVCREIRTIPLFSIFFCTLSSFTVSVRL